MPKIVRPISLYYDQKKYAEVTSGDYKVTSGNESMIADGGWIGESDGAITTEISVKTIVPVSGQTVDPVAEIVRRRYAKASMLIGGKRHDVDVKPFSSGASWDHKTGMVNGDFMLKGGEPKLTG